MSATRTLRRQQKTWNKGPAIRQVRKGQYAGRELWEFRDGDLLRSYHATKGHRCVRQPA